MAVDYVLGSFLSMIEALLAETLWLKPLKEKTFYYDPQSTKCPTLTTTNSQTNNPQNTNSAQTSGSKLPIVAGAVGAAAVESRIEREQSSEYVDLMEPKSSFSYSAPYESSVNSIPGSQHSDGTFTSSIVLSTAQPNAHAAPRTYPPSSNSTRPNPQQQTTTQQPNKSEKYLESGSSNVKSSQPSQARPNPSRPTNNTITSNVQITPTLSRTEKSALFDNANASRMEQTNGYDDEKKTMRNEMEIENIEQNAVEVNLVRQFGVPILWGHQQVMEWVRLKAFDDNVVRIFKEHAVDGSILHSFTKDPTVLKEDLGITNYVVRAKIIQSIEIMQWEADSSRSRGQPFVGRSLTTWSANGVPPPAYE
ncbi:hypothetical protein HDU76_002432 [Blyttiomyces sp. JEL0837]|nr:hypothetical protein HDU76_002432 [Blyttiomyces sp. JEL0837]